MTFFDTIKAARVARKYWVLIVFCTTSLPAAAHVTLEYQVANAGSYSKAGMLYWPVSQICEEGKVDWAEVPKTGQKMSDFKNPAAALELMPAVGGGEHNH